MARSRHGSIAGYGLLFVLGVTAYLWSLSPTLVFILGASLAALFVLAIWPKRCQVCGKLIKRSSHTWRIGGQKKRVCPSCNQALERKQSRRAV